MPVNGWNVVIGEEDKYVQKIDIKHGTTTSRIALQPTAEQIFTLDDKSITLQIGNDEKDTFLAYATGGKPEIDYTMQATIKDTTQEIKKRT